MELLDIPVIGNLYTWFNSSGSCKSILDRFLISEVLSKECGVMVQHVGLYVGGNHRRINFWKPIVECFRVRLSTCKGKLLSIGGRVTLINSVLTNFPIYQLSVFKIPAKVVK